MRLKGRTHLVDLLHREDYDVIAFWSDGRWTPVSCGYGGEQDGDNPAFQLSRSHFYGQPRRRCRKMVEALELALENESDFEEEYLRLGGVY